LKEAFLLSEKRLKQKRKQFSRAAKHNPYKTWAILGVSVLLITLLVFKVTSSPETGGSAFAFGEPVAESRSYVGKLISMTEVEPLIEDEMIKIPLEAVDSNNIVSFTVENDQGFAVPMMAYITPSGRLFAGSSMCEPCRGRTFSLAGETLVCDTCRTTYTIEDHQFISGAQACGAYPPVYMDPLVEDGTINIELDKVLSWRIRAL
jgi:hypothetical protein